VAARAIDLVYSRVDLVYERPSEATFNMTRFHRSAYELSAAQVDTPPRVVRFFWELLRGRRSRFPEVLDFGAGDGRFAIGGHFRSYLGVEIDRRCRLQPNAPRSARLRYGCAFAMDLPAYDACIGNPPYVRHHDIERPWKEKTTQRIEQALGIDLDLHGNLYLLFLCLGILKSKADGLLAFVIPFEWTDKPTARPIRDHIRAQGWNVDVYRLCFPVFPKVLTTASITIVDKSSSDGQWRFFHVDQDFSIKQVAHPTGRSLRPLPYAGRGRVWARRGISPGNQKVFVLTEGERVHAGLRMEDVRPAVTSLRHLPKDLAVLDEASFRRLFVEGGHRCWLLRSTEPRLSPQLRRYLAHVDPALRDNYTCKNQDPWYSYETAPIPPLLFHSCFTDAGTKVLINKVEAQAIGTIYGVHPKSSRQTAPLRDYLARFRFGARIVPQAKTLRKIEVRQLNHVLQGWSATVK